VCGCGGRKEGGRGELRRHRVRVFLPQLTPAPSIGLVRSHSTQISATAAGFTPGTPPLPAPKQPRGLADVLLLVPGTVLPFVQCLLVSYRNHASEDQTLFCVQTPASK